MPLFMDFHIFSDNKITIEGVKEAHVADLSIQDKYNVKYHQFWINEEAGTVFCLMEGPDKETCEQVHREAHGAVACEIVEVEGGFYDAFVGKSIKADGHIVRHNNGEVDNANRFIVVIDIIGVSNVKGPSDLKNLILPKSARKLVVDAIEKYEGNEVRQIQDSIIGIFINADHALRCAVNIQETINAKKAKYSSQNEWNIEYRIGLSGGQPVTKNKGFLEETITTGQRLCLIAEYGEIIISNAVEKLSRFNQNTNEHTFIRIIENNEQKFLDNLFDLAEINLSSNTFNINILSQKIGISRPQLYRKITAITRRSPNTFIRDLKMSKALKLIKERQLNVSEIALEVGYSNPSYFSKCFQEKYGVVPSQFITS